MTKRLDHQKRKQVAKILNVSENAVKLDTDCIKELCNHHGTGEIKDPEHERKEMEELFHEEYFEYPDHERKEMEELFHEEEQFKYPEQKDPKKW